MSHPDPLYDINDEDDDILFHPELEEAIDDLDYYEYDGFDDEDFYGEDY